VTVIGTDASFKAGGPQPTGIEEAQASATVAVPREQLGIVSDSLLAAVITTKEEQRTSHFKADASHPTLAHLQMQMGGLAPLVGADEAERGQYAALLGLLPRGAKRRISVPLGEMDSAYAALANVIRFAARVMAHVERAGTAREGGGFAAEELAIYEKMPYVAFRGAVEEGGEVLASTEAALLNDEWREALPLYREAYYL